jgi:HEAT repeat protein
VKNILICGVFFLLLILVSLGVISWVKYFAPISGLKDEDPEVRRRAVENLAESWVPDRVTHLTVALKDADFEVRDAATRALGNIGPDAEAAVESLMRIHKDDRERFQKEDTERGVQLTSHVPFPPNVGSVPSGMRLLKRISYALVALGKIGEPGLEPFITDLQDKNTSVREQAAESLGLIILAVPQPNLAQKAIQPLINALQDEDVRVRRAAATAIPEVVSASKNPETRATVAKALIRSMKDRGVTWPATGALIMIAEDGLEPLISILEDEDTPEPHVGHAVEDPQSRGTTVERLIRIMAHREEIRGEVHLPLLIGRRGLNRFTADRPMMSGFGPLTLHKIGEPALEPLINALQDEDVRMRRVAAMAMQVVLPNVKDPQIRARAVEPLIRAMKDADRKVHWYALSALSQIGEPALEPLINALQDEDGRMRSGAAMAMQIILPAIEDPQTRARAVEPLIRAMKDADSQVRGCAAVALSKIATEKAKNALRDAGFDKYLKGDK